MFMHTKLQNMEESSYVPNAIPPSLVVFSQAGYGDTIRMQRPFGSQDGKDLNLTNLSPSSFGLRHMDSYGGLPAQLVHLQNPFLHPALEARLPFGSTGAFRPVVTSSTSSTPTSSTSSADERISVKGGGGLSSAFTAANLVNNRRKLDSIVESIEQQHHGRDGRSRGSASSQSQESSSYSQQGGGDKSSQNSSGAGSGGYMNGGQSRHSSSQRSSSPRENVHGGGASNSSSSPSIKQEERERADECCGGGGGGGGGGDDRDANATPNSDVTERSTPPEDTHPSKRRRNFGELSCPVCKMSLHPVDMESHLLAEVEQLMCLSRMHRNQQQRGRGDDGGALGGASSSSTDSSSIAVKKEGSAELSQDSRWETYQRVRVNRHSRLRLKTRRRREESGGNGGPHVTCPVCQIPLQGPAEQLSGHVEACLRKDGRYHNGDILDEDEPVDIEGDGDGDNHDLDEYDWMRSRRHLRPYHHDSSSNYPLAALNMTTTRRREEENDTMEVVVDGDDTSTYGYTQYTEADIHAAMNRTESRSPTPARNQDANSEGSSRWDDRESPVNSSCASDDGSSDQLGGNNVNHKMVIQALKHRVRELEKDTKSTNFNGGSHCLVCKDKYKKPVVSISCWHVHCELCWLRSLGSKKLCPQCNMITSAPDLRRVFF